MPGPKPLPKNVLAMRGSWRAGQPVDEQQVDPAVEIPDCPDHLLPEARRFWLSLAPELEKLRLVSKIDQAALSLVCQEWAWVVWHEKALQADIDAATKRRQDWDAREESKRVDPKRRKPYTPKPWTGGDGFYLATKNGHPAYNTHWVARNRHVMLLDRFLASFGMSPSARGRVTPSSPQLELPGLGATAAKDGFNAL